MGEKLQVREGAMGGLRTLDRTGHFVENLKQDYVKLKEETIPDRNDTGLSGEQYAEKHMEEGAESVVRQTGNQVQKQGKKAVQAWKMRQNTTKNKTDQEAWKGEQPQVTERGGTRPAIQNQSGHGNAPAMRTQMPTAGSDIIQRPYGVNHSAQRTESKAVFARRQGNIQIREKETTRHIKQWKGNLKQSSTGLTSSGVQGRSTILRISGSNASTSVKRYAAAEGKRAAKTMTIQGQKAVIKATRKTAERTREIAKLSAQGAKVVVKAGVTTVKAAAATVKGLIAAVASGGAVVIIILIIMVALFGGLFYVMQGNDGSSSQQVGAEVEAYTPVIQQYASKYGVVDYVELIKAVMMQESGGRGLDPMQAAEGAFNTRYPHEPNGIQDADYSIECGVQELKAALVSAGVESPIDMLHIKLALQGYNFGNEYIAWAIKKDGGYTVTNAAEFSDMMAQKMGWNRYGDKEYVAHVLQYYAYGNIMSGTGVGSEAIVQKALSQEGNVGGQPYWSWYGFGSRVAWCACFVSWCADQCGYIQDGTIPKFSYCQTGIELFKARGQWMGRSYVPKTGDIIFFDWGGDGHSDHVGIVVDTQNGQVNTIEGNSSNSVRKKSYAAGSGVIVGYGVPAY